MNSDENEVCHVCSLLVEENQHGILCEQCNTWLHQKCVKVLLKQYNELSNSQQGWNCNRCKSVSVSVNQGDIPVLGNDDVECHWGDMKSLRQIIQQLEARYNTIVTWKRNFFLVPRGSSGKSLISEAARII